MKALWDLSLAFLSRKRVALWSHLWLEEPKGEARQERGRAEKVPFRLHPRRSEKEKRVEGREREALSQMRHPSASLRSQGLRWVAGCAHRARSTDSASEAISKALEK